MHTNCARILELQFHDKIKIIENREKGEFLSSSHLSLSEDGSGIICDCRLHLKRLECWMQVKARNSGRRRAVITLYLSWRTRTIVSVSCSSWSWCKMQQQSKDDVVVIYSRSMESLEAENTTNRGDGRNMRFAWLHGWCHRIQCPIWAVLYIALSVFRSLSLAIVRYRCSIDACQKYDT